MDAAEVWGALAQVAPRFGTAPALFGVQHLFPLFRTAAVAVEFFG